MAFDAGVSRIAVPGRLLVAAERRDDQLAQRRAQLTLEVGIINEQKTTKLIRLLEEYRRDNPHVQDRHDPEAESMAEPSDTGAVLAAINETHARVEQTSS